MQEHNDGWRRKGARLARLETCHEPVFALISDWSPYVCLVLKLISTSAKTSILSNSRRVLASTQIAHRVSLQKLSL